jgi:raffinose/stachyose/melibiose transport system permease protein
MVVPSMVVILLWKWILAGDYGVLNMLLRAVGMDALVTPWLAKSSTALWAIIAINFPWIAGLPFLLYLTGLQNISEDLYEAAELEGAGRFQRIFYIDIPLLASQRKLVVTYMLIQAFQMFDQPFVLTSGGPGTSTLTPALYIYQRAFNYNQFGYSAAVGVVLFIAVVIITVLNQKFMKESDNMG